MNNFTETQISFLMKYYMMSREQIARLYHHEGCNLIQQKIKEFQLSKIARLKNM